MQAQTAPAPAEPVTSEDEEDAIVLSPFVIDASGDRGYAASNTLAGTRIRTDLADVGSSISVITQEMLTDLGATNNETVLAYAVNTEVGGARGNFSGNIGIGTERYQEQNLFTNPNGNTRVRGLTSADNTRNYFLSDIPWDSYNTSRIDLQRGPNAILSGLGSPAGIVNATTNGAEFRNRNKVEFAFDRFSSQRYILDVNREILPNELAVRVSLLRDDKKFRQSPAFQLDERAYAAVTYRPKALNNENSVFEVSGNFEYGNISSNRPRVIPPTDRYTPFWLPNSQGGVNKQVYDAYANDLDANNSPILGGAGLGEILSLRNSNRNQSWVYPGINSFGARRPNGTIEDASPINNDATPFIGGDAVGIEVFPTFAINSGLPFSEFGQYQPKTLTDPSIFDFYNKLIDGDNKREWSDWKAYQANISHTFFRNTFGYDLAYFKQDLERGQWSVLGWDNYIGVDINSTISENQPNPDVGRAYIQVENRDFGNGRQDTEREGKRANVFVEYNAARRLKGLLGRIIGVQRINGVAAEEGVKSDSRTYRIGDLDPASKMLFNRLGRIEGSDSIGTGFRYYLSDDLRAQQTAAGSNLPNLEMPVYQNMGGPVDIRYFDKTWTAGPAVNPGDVWTNPWGDTSFQSENPANYRGWTNRQGKFVTIFSPDRINDMSAEEYLTSTGTLSEFNVKSLIGVWQGYFWDKSIIGTFGYREDRYHTYQYTAADRQGTGRSDTGGADLRSTVYNWNNPSAYNDDKKVLTRNWGVTMHVNRLLGDPQMLPVNLSLYYNRGENFQPSGARIDAFGETLPPPNGETEEKSLMIATKDNKYSIRATKYETSVINSTSTGSVGNMWALEQVIGHPAGYIRQLAAGAASQDDYDAWIEKHGSLDRLNNVIIPAWFQFEKDLQSEFPGFTQAWITKNPSFANWGTNGTIPVGAGASTPAGMVFTEDSISKGYEVEFIANPTPNWRIALNGSKTEATRQNVPGAAFKEVAAYIYDKIENSPMGEAPQWWSGDAGGLKNQVPWTQFRPGYLQNSVLNGQSAIEVRKWRWNALTNYTFSEGRLKGLGVGGGFRYEDAAIVQYAPTKTEAGFNTIDLNNPFYTPDQKTVDLWISYERKLTKDINWRIQLNVYNVGGKNELTPISASVDYEALGNTPLTPGMKVPMKASGFTIREGMSWQITNSFEF